MPHLKLWGRPERPAPGLRTRLSVQALDDRTAPSSLLATEGDRQDVPTCIATGADLSSPSDGPTSSMLPIEGGCDKILRNLPPVIVDFTIVRLETGEYRITGRVIDEIPGGLVISFSGIPSADGQTATTNADGTFSLTLTLQSGGPDMGNVSAVTQDAGGLWSNVATVWVDPL